MNYREKIKKIVMFVIVLFYVGVVLWSVLSVPYSYTHIHKDNQITIKPRTHDNTFQILNNYIDIMDIVKKKPTIEIVEEPEIEYKHTSVNMLYQTSAKTYMDYRAITNKESTQYKLIHSDVITICEDGFLRDTDGFIGVAMGSYFGPIGSRYVCKLDNGKEIKVIKVEAKADQHTVDGFCGSTSYDIIEFVIDTKAIWMQQNKWGNGYIFSGNFNNYDIFNGKIISIDKIEVVEK